VTQRPLLALFRGGRELPAAVRQGFWELVDGLNLGARNMIGIAVATATAGIVVGTVTLTGLGLMMTGFVELISGGNVIIMLLLTAVTCLVLGMGIPTTAKLGAQAGLAIPLIAVHLFVFYFGIMADITPPVGLAAFAAAAISGEDPIKTGLQGSFYSLRTAILPFLFIFNPQILLIDIGHWLEAVVVISSNIVAMLLFSAATMGFWITRSRIWETVVLLAATLVLLNPEIVWGRVYPPKVDRPAGALFEVAESLPVGGRLVIEAEGLTLEGEEVRKTVSLRMGPPTPPKERLAATGLTATQLGDQVQVVQVDFGSQAAKLKLEPGFTVTRVIVQAERPSANWLYIPALLMAGLVYLAQRRRASPA
jgi:hypothetical protein